MKKMKRMTAALALVHVMSSASAIAGNKSPLISGKNNQHLIQSSRNFELSHFQKNRNAVRSNAQFELSPGQHCLNKKSVLLFALLLSHSMIQMNSSVAQAQALPKANATDPKQSFTSVGNSMARERKLNVHSIPGKLYWAQEMVEASAMQERVNDILRSKQAEDTSVQIAVIDSGIDTHSKEHFHCSDQLELYVINTSIPSNSVNADDWVYLTRRTDEMTADGDHGTGVAGLVAGKDEVGMIEKGFNLRMYQYTDDVDSAPYLFSLLETVCSEFQDPEGIVILNASFGPRIDDIDTHISRKIWHPFRMENLYKTRIDELAEKGCLVVVAAGNSGYRGPNFNKLDDAYLRVEAIDSMGNVAEFSSIGDVRAPGQDVWTLALTNPLQGGTDYSDDVADESSFAIKCSMGRGTSRSKCLLKSGTSFAAPIVSGIAAQVVRVLKSEPYFKKLTPPERIAVVNRILKRSESNGSVNGLKAVDLAEIWNQKAKDLIR